MALADFWELKDNQVLAGKSILNVYHLKRLLAGATAANVISAFIDHVLVPEIQPIQSNQLTRTTIECANLGDVTDFGSQDSSAFPGTRAQQIMPGFNVATIQFNRTRTDMKNGNKRYTAGNELDSDNGVWNAAFIVELGTLAAAMVDPWERNAAPGIDVCEFAILKRFCVVPAQDPCLKYRLPDALEIDANHYVPLASVIPANVRSQVSRKVL